MTGLVERGLDGSNGKISHMFIPDGSECHARGTLGKNTGYISIFQIKSLTACEVRSLACTLVQTISWFRNIVSAWAAPPRWHTRVRMELSCQGYSEKHGLRQLVQLRQMRDSSV